MPAFNSKNEIFESGAIQEQDKRIVVVDRELLFKKVIFDIALTIAVTADQGLKQFCCWIAHELAFEYNVFPASIAGLYDAMGNHKTPVFTVPALNIRTMTFDVARMVFRSAKEINAGAFIFEIATSEIIYSRQRPMEYGALVLLAAVKEGYEGPVFLQGDHFQVNSKEYAKGKEFGLAPIKSLITEAVNAGYYNIDIDSSTLVDLSKKIISEQQTLNYEACALLTKFIRDIQPQGLAISIGGEIGEVGAHNSTEDEFNSFMAGYIAALDGEKGIVKMSIQTGTSHGGVVLPDGTIAKAKLDFDTLERLSRLARERYKMAGCVQHGASTLPNEAFHNFPQVKCAEIHLATQFQNIIFDYMPLSLKERIYGWLHDRFVNIKNEGETNDQFIYKNRKYALGEFKTDICTLPADARERICKVLKSEFDFLFSQLKINDSYDIVCKFINPVKVRIPREMFLKPLPILAGFDGID